MTTEEDVLSQWYDALYREDSLQVMGLLADHPRLLEVGWGDEASQVRWKEKPWKERTALHVGVKRGNVELVKQVLILCKEVTPKDGRKKKQERGNSPSVNGKILDLAEIEEAHMNDNNIAGPCENDTTGEDDRQPAEKAGSKAVSSLSLSRREGDEKSQQIAHLVIAKLRKRQIDESTFVEEPAKDQNDTFLHRLLMSKDGECDLDAIAIAALHGNCKIFLLLLYAMGECKLYRVEKDSLPPLYVTEDSEEERAYKDRLREATEQVVQSFSLESTSISCLEEYKMHLDFNFLPWQEYLFHFLFTCDFLNDASKGDFAKALWTAVKSCPDSPWRFLLKLQDGQGRAPLHVAVDEDSSWMFVYVVTNSKGEINDGDIEEEVVEWAMTARDGADRTALHRACSMGKFASGLLYLSGFPDIAGNETLELVFRERWQHSIPHVVLEYTSTTFLVDSLSSQNGFHGKGIELAANDKGTKVERMTIVQSNPLQAAILHKQAHVLWKAMKHCSSTRFEEAGESSLSQEIWKDWGLHVAFPWVLEDTAHGKGTAKVELDALGLVALVGDTRDAKCLVGCKSYSELDEVSRRKKSLDEVSRSRKRLDEVSRRRKRLSCPALHIAANAGNYEMLKLLLDDPLCDPSTQDTKGNNTLHHALNVISIPKFETHLLDYVNCKHLQSNDPRKENKEISGIDALAGRQGCIELLLGAGCDILKSNTEGQTPDPYGKVSKNSKFLSWWYERKAKEVEIVQSTVSSAASAVSVTGALIATTSYVGPLQPPMGLAGDPPQIQDENLWVKIFIFADTMSFYLAFIAIVLSLVPSLPVPQQHRIVYLQTNRKMIEASAMIVIYSVLFVLVAFVSSSIAVVSANATSAGGSITISTACVGGLCVYLTVSFLCIRFLSLYNVLNYRKLDGTIQNFLLSYFG